MYFVGREGQERREKRS